MKTRNIIAALFVLSTLTGWAKDTNAKIIAQEKGSITFVVDEKLGKVEKQKTYLVKGDLIASNLINNWRSPKEKKQIIASSFGDEQLMNLGEDAFYQCIVRAYANHQSVVLTPDMIWILITQGFSNYVNAHSKEMRPLLVNHEGKKKLVVSSSEDLLSQKADWPKLVGDFTSQIQENTKDDIANTITADFTTTSPVERIASQMTLMECMKSYFEYVVMRISCGIPSITLKGTPEDWQSVLDKTRKLEDYEIGKWLKELEPILAEFVHAAEGTPNQEFWQDIVKKHRVKKFRGGGCSDEMPTMLDGWLLKFFPNEEGVTRDHVPYTKDMPAEQVRVGFKYQIVRPDGTLEKEIPLELRAGFVGAVEDTLTNTLTPKIGWFVHEAIEEPKKDSK
ncbi:MAG: DUF4419 domain-containing protein [Bacteroidaceae bacterium]|nr:DUF4419 domain-containing protein [Bacteroidaceae bacterium]